MSDQGSQLIGELPSLDAESSGIDNGASQMPSPKSREPVGDPLDQIADLLQPQEEEKEQEVDAVPERTTVDAEPETEGGEEDPGGEEPDQEEAQEEARIETLKDAARKLDIEAAELYSMKIPMGQGESLTLGELKDLATKQDGWVQESAQREQQLTERETTLARDQQELAYLQEEIVANVPPEVLQNAQVRRETHLRKENYLLHQALPKFQDHNYFSAWQNNAVEYVQRFGFRPHELQVSDHRLIVLLDHAMQQEERLDRLANATIKREEAPARRKPQGLKPQRRTSSPKVANGRDEHLNHLANLVKGTI